MKLSLGAGWSGECSFFPPLVERNRNVFLTGPWSTSMILSGSVFLCSPAYPEQYPSQRALAELIWTLGPIMAHPTQRGSGEGQYNPIASLLVATSHSRGAPRDGLRGERLGDWG